ncbi:hypothetical protein G6F50_018382 [Rhizopus delemar]|uniref:Uncharacterized protein n=1 Tax=Rhizopus delemar TaxID=936053 RepID=A0A9P6XN02_9FUNG|nr:hypothetical protein G6F50_018382 [Rhizopus delemar]
MALRCLASSACCSPIRPVTRLGAGPPKDWRPATLRTGSRHAAISSSRSATCRPSCWAAAALTIWGVMSLAGIPASNACRTTAPMM